MLNEMDPSLIFFKHVNDVLSLTCERDSTTADFPSWWRKRSSTFDNPAYIVKTRIDGLPTREDITEFRGPFYQHGLTLIPTWVSNYMSSKVWGEITCPFLNFNGWTVEV